MKKINTSKTTSESAKDGLKSGVVQQQKEIQQTTWPIILTTLINASDKHWNNMDMQNYRSVKTPWNMVARSFLKVSLDGEDAIKYFYLRTKTGDIYKVFKKWIDGLDPIVKDRNKLQDIIENCPTERLLFNPKTGNLVGIENPIIECWKQFICAKNITTPPVLEIVWFRGTWTGEDDSISLTSSIEQEYKQQKKKQ